ncbi:MAG: hypothetical protein LBI10_04230 [Deltaproteobacteria bacterium]|jgi:hypothetical protein|nr:hypothetical protein [Deltaproteobacteria bacterium]
MGKKTRPKTAGLALAAIIIVAVMAAIFLGPGAVSPTLAAKDFDLAETIEDIESLDSLTNLAISPGFILWIRGVHGFFTIKDKEKAPFYASGYFILGLGAILLLFLGKDFMPFEPLQKFLTAMEEGSMSLWGLLGYLTFIPEISSIMTPSAKVAVSLFLAEPALAADSAASGEPGFLVSFLATVVGTVIYWIVWLVSNSLNVLCLIAPSFVAPLLKGFRLALVGAIWALATIHPALGLIAALIVLGGAIILVRWSFRLSVWGLLFSFDLVFRRWRQPDPPADAGILAFASAKAKKTLKIPKRTLGRLFKRGENLYFSYRKFLLRPTEIQLEPGSYVIGRRLTAPVLAARDQKGELWPLFSFRLSLKGHDSFLLSTLGVSNVVEMGVLKSAKKAIAWLKSLIHGDEEALELT